MELSKDEPIFKKIDFLNQHLNNNKIILNFYNNYLWNETNFNNFTSILRTNYNEIINDEILEVYNNSNILSIFKNNEISKYCLTNDLTNINHIFENFELINKDSINDLFDVKLDFEVYNKIKIEQPDFWDKDKKIFKYMKDFSYNLNNGNIAIARIIKTDNKLYDTFKNSKILSLPQNYEFSLIINDTSTLLSSIIIIIKSLFMSNIILTKKQQTIILEDYLKLIKKDIFIPNYYKSIPLITPKPSTLEKINLVNPDEYGSISILKNYVVTEKADGERILMYINNIGNVYLINSSLNVEDSGLKANKEIYNSLIDGEYIKCDKRRDNTKKNIFAAFDIYYLNNKNLTSLPLIGGRNLELAKIINLFDLKYSNFEYIIMKNHYNSGNILNDCKEILNNSHQYPYEIDGLIFTPAKLPLFSHYPSVPVQITPSMSWDKLFKWKPPEQNSIDFLIKFIEDIKIDGINYKKIGLYVGINILLSKNFTIDEALKLRYDKNYSKNKYIEEKKLKKNNLDYVPILFKPVIYYHKDLEYAFIKIDNKGNIKTDDNNIIYDNSIVEFSYNMNLKKWIPIRNRYDKTNIYRNGTFLKTANAYNVAINIWRSINNPISTELITGSISLLNRDIINEGKDLESDDIYYSKGIPRKSLLSYNMVTFHNLIINDMLYSKSKNKNSLLELACGQGSSLNRWLNYGYNFILGIDYAKDNIYNPVNGAYSRVLNEFNKFNINKSIERGYFPNIVFAVGDCSLDIKSGISGIDNESKELLKLVLNNNYKNNKFHFKHIIGKGANKFDVISCMFAIHYFFENEEKLHGFLNNIVSNIKNNGIFICTFMDGEIIEKELNINNGIIKGYKNLNNTDILVWAILKRFINNNSFYNKKIDVFLENTQKLIPEYLVNFDFLINKMKQFGLQLVETELFSQTFNSYLANINIKQNKLSAIDSSILELNKEDVQKKLSFFNRWAIFKKIN